MARASSLAARIRDIFGINSTLVEGHDGIFEVGINGQAVVSSKGCSTPSEEDILKAIGEHTPSLQGKDRAIKTTIPMMKT